MVYAKLIGAIAQHWILVSATWTHIERSLMKAAVTLREWIMILTEALDDLERLVGVLTRLAEALAGDKVERRGKHPSLFQLLENPELLDWRF